MLLSSVLPTGVALQKSLHLMVQKIGDTTTQDPAWPDFSSEVVQSTKRSPCIWNGTHHAMSGGAISRSTGRVVERLDDGGECRPTSLQLFQCRVVLHFSVQIVVISRDVKVHAEISTVLTNEGVSSTPSTLNNRWVKDTLSDATNGDRVVQHTRQLPTISEPSIATRVGTTGRQN